MILISSAVFRRRHARHAMEEEGSKKLPDKLGFSQDKTLKQGLEDQTLSIRKKRS